MHSIFLLLPLLLSCHVCMFDYGNSLSLPQEETTALRQWNSNMSTSLILGVPNIPSNNPSSTEHNTKQSAVLPSALARNSLAICISTTLLKRTSGDTIRVTVFSLIHMPTVSCPVAGERRMALHGQGMNISP